MSERKTTAKDAIEDLYARVENLERRTEVPAPVDVEQEQADRDKELLFRLPASYDEAVAQEAARKRESARDTQKPGGDK